ncbi:MAG: NAD-dependent isocitrate dehydrogenase [Ignavibacteria bacterium]|nr:NAD-dependent isocitrate dehydrogenase [Ignavibacteria bacterium]
MTKVTLIEGDGIGPEISAAVVKIFEAAKVPIEWEYAVAGLTAIEQGGRGVPPETLDSIKRNGLALKGPTTTPVGGGHKSVNVAIRTSLELYANVRLARTMPAVETRFKNVDILVVRENVEDTYSGIEHFQTPNVAQGLKLITRQGSLAVIRYAFEQTRKLGRNKVTCVHKANIHKLTDGLFLEVFRQVAAEYTDIETSDIIVDNCCMQLVTRPEQFDVLVLPNLYGDIVSDLCAGIVGGLGVAPGGNIGRTCAVFEAVHGSAPDIAGKGLANPTALLLSGIQMLQFMGWIGYAQAIQDALSSTLAADMKTRDLGGVLSTNDFTNEIIARLKPAISIVSDSTVADRVTHPVPETISEEWVLNGVDVFIEWSGELTNVPELPDVPEKIGPLTLAMMSNRGTKVWPGEMPDIMLVDHFRVRYLSDKLITRLDVINVLVELDSLDFKWGHIEILNSVNKQPRYSNAKSD